MYPKHLVISSGSLYDRPARFYRFYRIHCLSAPFIHSCVNNPCLSDCSFACNSCTSTAAQQYERSERGKNSEKWLKSTPQRQHHGLSAFQTSVPGDKTVKTLSFGKIGCVLLLDCPGSTHRAESVLLGSSHAASSQSFTARKKTIAADQTCSHCIATFFQIGLVSSPLPPPNLPLWGDMWHLGSSLFYYYFDCVCVCHIYIHTYICMYLYI